MGFHGNGVPPQKHRLYAQESGDTGNLPAPQPQVARLYGKCCFEGSYNHFAKFSEGWYMNLLDTQSIVMLLALMTSANLTVSS